MVLFGLGSGAHTDPICIAKRLSQNFCQFQKVSYMTFVMSPFYIRSNLLYIEEHENNINTFHVVKYTNLLLLDPSFKIIAKKLNSFWKEPWWMSYIPVE